MEPEQKVKSLFCVPIDALGIGSVDLNESACQLNHINLAGLEKAGNLVKKMDSIGFRWTL